MSEPMKPGVYPGIDPEVYHTDPGSVSHSMLMKLYGPGRTPARFAAGWRTDPTRDMGFGKLVHGLLFGEEHLFVVSPFDSFRTKAAKEWKVEQALAGVSIVTEDEMETARQMVQAIRDHGTAGPLFTDGQPEVSVFWEDAETGLTCRARIDWLRNVVPGRRLIVPDYKTTDSADEVEFAKSAAKYGYHRQQAFYEDAMRAAGLDPDPLFVFVAQEKADPYLVNVITLDPADVALGRELNRNALRLYAECKRTDNWPGYGPSVKTVSLPGYARYAAEELLNR